MKVTDIVPKQLSQHFLSLRWKYGSNSFLIFPRKAAVRTTRQSWGTPWFEKSSHPVLERLFLKSN